MAKAEPPAGTTVTYQQRMTRCGKADCPRCAHYNAGHGPYWYATWRQDGRQYTSYVGKQLPPKVTVPAVQEARSKPAPAVDSVAPLRVRTLGAFEVWRGEMPIPADVWSRRKAASLFKALLGAPGQRLHREQAADLLWPETDADLAANNLRATLHVLRKIVDAPGQPRSYLRTEGELLALSPSPTSASDLHWWDAAAFERQAAAALASEDAAACRAALILYGGEYLPDDRYEPWAADRRTHLHQQRQSLLLHLATVHSRQDAHAESAQCLRAVLESDPCHERAARALLRLLVRTGQQAEAARVYQSLAIALREELGVTPSAKTEALRATLLTQEASPTIADAIPRGFEEHLPGGTVTFLMTDLDADTALWNQTPAEMHAALARHNTLLAGVVAAHGGRRFKGRGERNGVCAVFNRPRTALAAACALQQALLAEPWLSQTPLRVRAALHSGEADVRDGEYHGIAVTRCARLRALGHGGQILLSQTTADLLRDALPEGVRLRALGAHQLKGMERLEEVYQLLHPALPAEFPPLQSPQAPRNNLPAMLSSFIGRERAQDEVRQLLAAARLLTLVGVGGVGKTRLAISVAEDLQEEYEDGVWLVELASLTDPALTTQAMATVLGLREEPGCPLLRTVTEHLHSKQALLVLDNCERLIGICAEIVTALLRNCPRLSSDVSAIMVLSNFSRGSKLVYRVPGIIDNPTPVVATQEPCQGDGIRRPEAGVVAVMPECPHAQPTECRYSGKTEQATKFSWSPETSLRPGEAPSVGFVLLIPTPRAMGHARAVVAKPPITMKESQIMLFSFRPRPTRACPMMTADRPIGRAGRSTRSASLEALEPRLVPSALGGSPPVAMLSLTETDSRSVTIAYRVDQAPDAGQPLRFGIYRSSDGQFGTGDVLIDSWQVGSTTQGQAGSPMDDAGQPADAPGIHRVTIPLPDGLPPDPQHPYVLAVADPSSPSAPGDPTQTASLRTHVIGIVTHGGLQNTRWKYGPAWQAEAAAVLRSQGYDAVIAYNWVAASNHPGRAAMQGPRLASQVLATAGQFPAGDPVDLHFIGHSEGAVVNTQAIVALEKMMTPQLNAGYIKDTLLDPHAANNAVPGQQYSLTSGPLGWLAKGEIDSFQSKAKDPAAFIPARVNDAEVFYQHTSASKSHGVNSGIYNLWGQVPVKGSAHYYNLTAAGATHAGETGVSQWYTNFVAPTLGDQAPRIRSLQLDGQVAHVDPTALGAGGERVVHDVRPEFTGTAAPGSTVHLYVGPASNPSKISPAGLTHADSSGKWTISTARPLPDGRYRAVAMAFSRASRSRPGQTVIPTLPLGSFVVAARTGRYRMS